jgi:glycosyltransferase involved in cell wall biosynthesis
MMANAIDNLHHCKGKYIAPLEGDDYWINPLKLQIQVDYLTAHPNCVVCYHSRIQVDGNGNLIKSYPDTAHDYSSEELLSGTSIPMTNTLLFRNIITNDFSKFEVFLGDALVLHLLGFYGYCKYISSIHNGAAYRIHDGGVWSRLSNYERVEAWLTTRKTIRKNIITSLPENKIVLDLHDKGYLIFFNTILCGLIFDKNIKKYFALVNDIRVDRDLCKKDIFLYHIAFVAKGIFKKITRKN